MSCRRLRMPLLQPRFCPFPADGLVSGHHPSQQHLQPRVSRAESSQSFPCCFAAEKWYAICVAAGLENDERIQLNTP